MYPSEQVMNPHLKIVGKIAGRFFVPAYQRGYRWGTHQVEALLDDIDANGQRGNYCLQPIVIKFNAGASVPGTEDMIGQGDGYFELIDGQQRLTTLYLIYRYLKQRITDLELRFSLSYQTRPKSTDYLRTLDSDQKDDNIDFFHMHGAYQCIGKWFEAAALRKELTPQFVGYQFYGYLAKQVHVIWYEAGDVDSTTLFTRLNVGRIALTNAELVKALLLARSVASGASDERRQIEVATQWDMIESELQDDQFWAFLTNKPSATYHTRIELIFDLMAKKKDDEKEIFLTFLYFKNRLEGKGADPADVWASVLNLFHLLREWYEDRDLFHKVGYLVAMGVSLAKLVNTSKDENLTKKLFRSYLDEEIKAKLDLNETTARQLSYDDRESCERLLLLFNVESVRRLEHSSERYPFHSHKAENWSLEHIDAQHAEPLKTEEEWRLWLKNSRRSLDLLRLDNINNQTAKQSLIDSIDRVLAGKVRGPDFKSLSQQIMEVEFLHPAGIDGKVHSINNLALLSVSVNSSLNNAAFYAKRQRVVALDRAGKFIPICTRHVFLKYYAEPDSQQMHLWSGEDRESYLQKMLSEDFGIGRYLRSPVEVLP